MIRTRHPNPFLMPKTQSGMVIGLFGGSFNPPHSGHLLVAEMAIKRLGLDKLWWMVTPANPLKEHRGLASVEDRVALSNALIMSPKIEITAFETTIASFYTAKTINYIKTHNRGVKFVLIMGADSLTNFHYWHHWRAIVASVPIAVIDRPSARMAGLSSHFAQTFAGARIKEQNAKSLAFHEPPAWCYLHGRRSDQSSTVLRRQIVGEAEPNLN